MSSSRDEKTSNSNSFQEDTNGDVFNLNFLDPGVSNGDVDWLFRGREIKKLSKRSNPINNEVQSQLLQAQQKALIQSKEDPIPNPTANSSSHSNSNSTSSLNSRSYSNPHANAHPSSKNDPLSNTGSSPVSIPLRGSDLPRKSSLKSSSVTSSNLGLSIDTSNILNTPPYSSSPLNSFQDSPMVSNRSASTSSDNPFSSIVTTANSNVNPSTTLTPTSATPTRSRSSSLFGRPKSSSNASETKPAKKSLLSALSSKLKPVSNQASSSSLNKNPPTPKSSTPLSPTVSRNITPTASRNKKTITVNPTNSTVLTNNNTPINQTNEPVKSLSDKKLDSISFKRVCFALNDLVEDPQQQIPSRRPKKGNVLIPEDMLAPPPKLSIGITNSFNEQTKNQKPNVDPKLYEEAVERQKYFLAESKKHSEEAHVAALRMAKEVSSFKKRKGSFLKSDDEDEDEENITDVRFLNNGDDALDIDTPIHEHVNYFGGDDSFSNDAVTGDIDPTISLETLYTRCCHLREILPIPATLKQLKDKSTPLHVLKMLNPKPTLIDILSFSDFLAIAPIITVIFDNVTIDSEMLKIVLVSLKNSTMLDKLSLRNVPIDHEGWKILCKYLKVNKHIQKLDISQQRLKKSSDHSKSILRSELDWDLFTDTLRSRGGIEELVLNGCTLNNNQFDNLVNNALILKTKRLGLASSQLDVPKMSILSKWISDPKTTCIGVDFGFNDLSEGQLTELNKILKLKGSQIKLQFFSLNSTNVTLPECTELIGHLSSLPSLKFIDLSNNPQLFPEIIPALRHNLPNYPDLRRLHFDFDNLTEFSIVQLCNVFQKCSKLVHVSLLGNTQTTTKTALALYSAVKNSHIYNIDMDYEGLDEELVSRIAFYLMRNMETFLNKNSISSSPGAGFDRSSNVSNDEDLIFDGSLLTKAAEHLLENDKSLEGEERMIIYRSIVEKTIKLRTEIHNSMNKLFAARESGKLSIEGKENLLRMCLLDDSLENILDIFSDEVKSVDTKNTNNSSVEHISSRPDLIRQLSSQLTRHHSSGDVMQTGPMITSEFYQHPEDTIPQGATEAPHIVVADADSIPVDSTTGKRVLMRKFSQTSVHSKKLEEEEGELHRWGFFVQQQNDIMPDDSQNSKSGSVGNQMQEEREKERLRIEAEKAEQERLRLENEKKVLKINAIPSGSELRETIMKVKGIESISDLIRKVNKDFSTVEKIYKHADAKRVDKEGNIKSANDSVTSHASGSKNGTGSSNGAPAIDDPTKTDRNVNESLKSIDGNPIDDNDSILSPTVSINSFDGQHAKDQADEVYDRILNNVIRVRSNK